jgi:hypothetical protein
MTDPDEQSNEPKAQTKWSEIPFRDVPPPSDPDNAPSGSTKPNWDAPHGENGRCLEFCPICRTAEVLRATGPPELRGQLDEVGREALLTLRSLVDHYLERLDQQPAASDRVEKIPID